MATISLDEGKKILEQIKARPRLKYSGKKLVNLGKKRYEQIKAEVEAKDKNKFIVIEVESGDFFIDKDPVKAIVKARKRFPHAVFYRARIGYPAAFSIKSNVHLL
jgi:hypothetical protein